MKQTLFKRLRNKTANIWVTVLAVLAIIAVFIFAQVMFMISRQSGGSALNTSQASGALTQNYQERMAAKVKKLCDLLPAMCPTKAAAPNSGNTAVDPAKSSNDVGQTPLPPAAPAPPITALKVLLPDYNKDSPNLPRNTAVMYWTQPMMNNAPRSSYLIKWQSPRVAYHAVQRPTTNPGGFPFPQVETGPVTISLVQYTSQCTATSCPASNKRYLIQDKWPNVGDYSLLPAPWYYPAAVNLGPHRTVPDNVPAGQYVMEIKDGVESDVSDEPFAVIDNPIPDIWLADVSGSNSPSDPLWTQCFNFSLKPGQRVYASHWMDFEVERGSTIIDTVKISVSSSVFASESFARQHFVLKVGQTQGDQYTFQPQLNNVQSRFFITYQGLDGGAAKFQVRPYTLSSCGG